MSSEPDAQISGSKAKPNTKRMLARAVTTSPTSNSWLALAAPAAKIALLNDATEVSQHAVIDTYSLEVNASPIRTALREHAYTCATNSSSVSADDCVVLQM